MKTFLFKRRTPLVALFLLLVVGLMFAGASQGGPSGATAATAPIPGPEPPFEIPLPPLGALVASDLSPANGDTEVALSKSVTVKFNKDIDTLTLTSSSFKIKRKGYIAYLGATRSYNALTNVATLNPTSNLLPETFYEVTLTDAIETPGGTPLWNPQTWEFKTIAYPRVSTKTPASAAVDIPVDAAVSVTFDHDMDWSTVTGSSFYIQKSGGGSVTAALTKSVDKRTATLTPTADLLEATTYVVTLTVAARAVNGLYLQAPVTWTFTTGATAPEVTTKVPANGATGVPVDQVVAATFDMDMDDSTITSATFYIQKSGGSPLPSMVDYEDVGRTAYLEPMASLETGATYEVTLTTAVESDNGAPLAAPVTWSFTTLGEAPMVTSKVPASGATGVPVDQVVAATFDSDMNGVTITGATFYLQKLGESPLPAVVSYSAATHTATLTPSDDLEAGAAYQVTLAAAVQGADGQGLAGAPVVWSFSTAGGTSSFTDVIPGVTPYAAAIIALADEGVVSGFEDDTFRPYALVTRQQFAKMIVLARHFTVTGSEVCPFTDVADQEGTDPFYPSKYVAVCAAEGITQGKTPTLFAPRENITHQQLITMVARAANLSDPPAEYTPSFTAAQFSLNDHYLNARKAAYAGLLDGLLGVGPTYDFLAGSTRGECAQLLYNLMMLMAS